MRLLRRLAEAAYFFQGSRTAFPRPRQRTGIGPQRFRLASHLGSPTSQSKTMSGVQTAIQRMHIQKKSSAAPGGGVSGSRSVVMKPWRRMIGKIGNHSTLMNAPPKYNKASAAIP